MGNLEIVPRGTWLCEEEFELERETGFEPATLALAILKIEILERLDGVMVPP